MSGPVYLLSSLPYLDVSILNSIGDNNAVSLDAMYSIEDFISFCEHILSPADAQKFTIAMRNPEESTLDFVSCALEYMSSVTNALAQKRHEERRSGSYVPTIVNDRIPVSADAPRIVERITHAKNPLIREIEILRSLWTYLDDCDSKYQYTLENVIIYGYKLKLFHKAISFQKEAGDATWKQLCEVLAEKAGFLRSILPKNEDVDRSDETNVAEL